MANALQVAIGEMMAFTSAIGTVKAFSQATFTAGGQDYKIYTDEVDAQAAPKEASVKAAVAAIVARGFKLPTDMRFYLTSAYAAQNRAFHFDPQGRPISWTTLGITAMKGGSGNGISAQNTPGYDACTKIAIHEVAHSLHGRAVGMQEFFRPKVADRWRGSVENAGDVSAYAANSKKEFVAEVFLGTLIGRTYSDPLKKSYRDLDGPNVTGFI